MISPSLRGGESGEDKIVIMGDCGLWPLHQHSMILQLRRTLRTGGCTTSSTKHLHLTGLWEDSLSLMVAAIFPTYLHNTYRDPWHLATAAATWLIT